MSPDETPVANFETLLRRVPSDPAKFHFPTGPVDLNAFLPSPEDDDGLSLYRRLEAGTETGFLTAQELLARAINPRVREYGGIAAVQAEAVLSITPLTIEPKPDELPGHVIIPEMNRKSYDASKDMKRQIKVWADLIARACHIPMPIDPKPIPQ